MIERGNYITRDRRAVTELVRTEDLPYIISHFSFVIGKSWNSCPPEPETSNLEQKHSILNIMTNEKFEMIRKWIEILHQKGSINSVDYSHSIVLGGFELMS